MAQAPGAAYDRRVTMRLLIADAGLLDGSRADVRVADGKVVAVGPLVSEPGERVIRADGNLLIPGLHDHHLHVLAAAAARQSARCGPPGVRSADDLAAVLSQPGEGWFRATGFDEGAVGEIDRRWLDAAVPQRPVRLQHRSGRLWVLNSAGLDLLLAGREAPPNLDVASGRLFDGDAWLRETLGGEVPDLARFGADLAAMGLTGLTDMGPANGPDEAQLLSVLPQRVVVGGEAGLWSADGPLRIGERAAAGPFKVHLHEAAFPDFERLAGEVAAAHALGRGAAFHCVTEAELAFALGVLAAAGHHAADRIEHASVTTDALLAAIVEAGVNVCVQPGFVHARGDAYRRDIPAQDWPDLYRLRAFAEAGVPLAGGSDAPYVPVNPWLGMASAVQRRTRDGNRLGTGEALTPREALALYLADPLDFRRAREVAAGEPADLVLLSAPWPEVAARLAGVDPEQAGEGLVRLTLVAGRAVHDGIDQAPLERGPRPDPAA